MTDLTNYHPHSRYTLHEKAYLFPFRDLIWNKADGPFIDLKVDFPDPANHYADGTAYLRVEDVVEMAHVLGMSTREETEALKKENAELRARLNELPTKVEGYKDELARVTNSFLSSLDSPVSVVVPASEEAGSKESDSNKAESTGSEDLSGSDKAASGNDSVSVSSVKSDKQSGSKSSSVKGPDDLSGALGNATDNPLAGILGIPS